jgi:hypothetical protein
MAGDKVNNYAQDDTNILELQLTTDKTFKGYHQLTLTNYDNTTVPAIAAGSCIEVNGALYKFDSEEAISTTDPVTSAAVADGTVYVCIIPDTTTATAAFTATAPTWSDSKQGWYGTGGQANYRYAEFIITKATTSYSPKLKMSKKSLNVFLSEDATERSTTSTTSVDETNLTLTFTALPDVWYEINLFGEFKKDSGGAVVYITKISGNGTVYNINPGIYSLIFPSSYVNYKSNASFYSGDGGSVSFRMTWQANISGTLYAENRILKARLIDEK